MNGASIEPAGAGSSTETPRVTLLGAAYHIPTRGRIDFPSLDVQQGARCTLMGPSGSGKSTLCRVLGHRLPSALLAELHDRLAIEPYFAGTLTFEAAALPRCTYIGPIPIRHMMAFRVADFFQTSAQAADVLESVGIPSGYTTRDPTTLSTGEAIRVLLAAAMARAAPAVLDGPWTWLDRESRAQIASVVFTSLRSQFVVDTEGPVAVFGSPLQDIGLLQGTSATAEGLQQLVARLRRRRDHAHCGRVIKVSARVVIASTKQTPHDIVCADQMIKQGTVTWACGPNGSGKSTLCRSLASLPLADEVRADSHLRLNGSADISVGYVPCSTAQRNARLAGVTGRLLGAQRAEAPSGALDGSEHIIAGLPQSVSAIIRSVNDQTRLARSVIFIDEPFASVTRDEALLMWSLFEEMARITGAAIVVVSHVEGSATSCDTLVFYLSTRSGRRITEVRAIPST